MAKPSPSPPPERLPAHPFTWLPEARQMRALVGATLLTALLMAAIFVTNAPLQNPAAPMGVVSLQLAGSLPAAREILISWGPAEQRWAVLNLLVDYLYLLAYAAALGLGCLQLARQFICCRCIAWLGVWVSWGVVGAAGLDAVENALLLRLLFGDLRESWAVLAFWCAVPKFALVLAALAYLSVGGLVCLVRKVAAA